MTGPSDLKESTQPQTVLVTGGSGFIAGWAIADLLKRGYTVRATLRSLTQEPRIRAALATQTDPGERFIAAGDWMWMVDVARVLREELGDEAAKAPTKMMPDLMLRLGALFDPKARFAVPLLGRKHVFSSAKAKAKLGWAPRPAGDTIIDAARSAIALGASGAS